MIIIDNKTYPDKTIFKVIVPDSWVIHTDKKEIKDLPVVFLQPGMTIIDENRNIRIKNIKVVPEDNRVPFYHMHIYKTSGVSIYANLVEYFNDLQVYRNYISYINDELLLSSSFISGHFASYPVDLFLKNNKKLHTFTLLRDPVDRCISEYLYKNKFITTEEKPSVEGFELYMLSERFTQNLQSKNITSSLDVTSAKTISSFALSDLDIRRQQWPYDAYVKDPRSLAKETNEKNWKDHINKFSLIGTLENKKDFDIKINSLIQSEGYLSHKVNDLYLNRSPFSTSEFKKTLPKHVIDKIIYINQHDVEMYDFIKSRGV